jgi:hypothetical protein
MTEQPQELATLKSRGTSYGMTQTCRVCGFAVESGRALCPDSFGCLGRVAAKHSSTTHQECPPAAPAAPPCDAAMVSRSRSIATVRTKATAMDNSLRVAGEWSADLETCWYCGDLANTVDHVRARCSTLSGCGSGPVVPACNDCNCSILNSIPVHTDADRGRRVAAVLRMRVINTDKPRWTVDEAREELAGRLLQRVLHRINKFHTLALRADFATNRWPEPE